MSEKPSAQQNRMTYTSLIEDQKELFKILKERIAKKAELLDPQPIFDLKIKQKPTQIPKK